MGLSSPLRQIKDAHLLHKQCQDRRRHHSGLVQAGLGKGPAMPDPRGHFLGTLLGVWEERVVAIPSRRWKALDTGGPVESMDRS